jgi:alpha-beta hydrolase superfamily lysophospholipase
LDPFNVGIIPVRKFAPPPELGGGTRGAVLLYHGLRMGGDSLAREAGWLASAGLTTYAVDAPHHGGRHSDVVGNMPDAMTIDGHRVLLRILREARDEVGQLVDYVHAQGHAKVAICGVSLGGFIALAAGAAEPRFDAVVSILGTPDWTPHTGDVPPDLVDAVTESPHLRPEKYPPRPMLLLNASRDDNVRPGGARVLTARLRPLYSAIPNSGPLIHREYDSEHYVHESHWSDMWATTIGFLVRVLG